MKNFLIIFFLILFSSFSLAWTESMQDILLKEKIAQMLIVGFNGQEMDEASQIYSDIKNLKIGGVILFSKNADKTKPDIEKNIKNPSQLKSLTSDLQKISKTPLFVGIDQEGGYVSRLNPCEFGVSAFSAKKLGVQNNLDFTYNEAFKTAFALKKLGINLNFVPCVDLEINKKSPIIASKERSFSANPYLVACHARAVIMAYEKAQVLTSLKHYPGHGSAMEDTHCGFVDVTGVFQSKELLPYKILIDDKSAKAIMISHIFDKNVDSSYPACMSDNFVKKKLINDMKFDGLIFSDDMQMRAISDNYSLEQVLFRSIKAGCDVIVFGNNISYQENIAQKSIDIIFSLVKSGQISEDRIDKSYKKILDYKKVYCY